MRPLGAGRLQLAHTIVGCHYEANGSSNDTGGSPPVLDSRRGVTSDACYAARAAPSLAASNLRKTRVATLSAKSL